MPLLIIIAAVVALVQAPPPTKAEQLQEAARKGDAATVKQLLDEGIDVNTKFRYGDDRVVLCLRSRSCRRGEGPAGQGRRSDGEGLVLRFHAADARGQPGAEEKTGAHRDCQAPHREGRARQRERALRAPSGRATRRSRSSSSTAAGYRPSNPADALEPRRRQTRRDRRAAGAGAGAKPPEEFKMDAAQLERFAGTYKNPAGNELVDRCRR